MSVIGNRAPRLGWHALTAPVGWHALTRAWLRSAGHPQALHRQRLSLAGILILAGTLGCAPAPIEDADSSAPSQPAAGETRPTDGSEPAAAGPAPITMPPDPLKERIHAAIEHVRQRDLLTTNAFWTIFHGMLAFGPGLSLRDPATSVRVPALDYIFAGRFDRGRIRGLEFIPTADGLDIRMGPTYVGQGHPDQFVGYFAQFGVPIDAPIFVEGNEYSVRDLIREIQAHAKLDIELSWTIIGIGNYVGTTGRWKNRDGEEISYDDLIRCELAAPVNTAACGGTHRLNGLTWAYHLHRRQGGAETDLWTEVDRHLQEHVRLAREYQNPDGSFSTEFFRGPGKSPEIQDRIGSTGHILEWLATVLPDAELTQPWMRDAAGTLALMILDAQSLPIESGALYHATHGLVLYHYRVFGWTDFDAPPAGPAGP